MTGPEMFAEEQFYNYVPREGGVLQRLEAEAVAEDVPIIGPVMGKLLYTLARATRSTRILELGTATGYSAIWMARAVEPVDGGIVTVEWDAEMAKRAEENIAEAGYGDQVKVVQGQAETFVDGLDDSTFDMAFLDIDKEFYSDAFRRTIRVLRPGGLMVFDNTAFRSGKDFLDVSWEHPDVETVHLYALLPNHEPDWDGITLCVKK